jgi:8-oxo-dGTP pyrophosphatase MutT (NUDIX family)
MPLTRWKTLSSRYPIRDQWLTLRADRCETETGLILDPYYVQEPRDWVHVVAFDSRDRILITRQYRHGAGIISTEIPCGTVEDNEAPLVAMQRELLEETGCAASQFFPLPSLSPNPACFTNRMHGFIATDARKVQEQNLDPSEQIEFEFLSISQVLALIDEGAFAQALHIASVFLALRQRRLPIADSP